MASSSNGNALQPISPRCQKELRTLGKWKNHIVSAVLVISCTQRATKLQRSKPPAPLSLAQTHESLDFLQYTNMFLPHIRSKVRPVVAQELRAILNRILQKNQWKHSLLVNVNFTVQGQAKKWLQKSAVSFGGNAPQRAKNIF